MPRKNKILQIGAHVSAAGGLVNAVKNGKKIGARCIQIFGSSPRSFAVRIPAAAAAAEFRSALRKSGLAAVYLHAPYLVRLGSDRPGLRGLSIKNLIGHLQIAETIGAGGLIFHLGSQGDAAKKDVLDKTIAGMQAVLRAVPGKTLLVMENSSGGGTKLGSGIDDLALLLKKVKSRRVRICFDTAHAFEAGELKYGDFAAVKKYFDAWHRKIGLDNLAVVHANDSQTAFGSGSDRHENIGQGFIGLRGFQNLAKEKRLWNKPWILEVPGFRGEGPDKKNLAILNSCFV